MIDRRVQMEQQYECDKEQLEEIERNVGKKNNEITSFGKMLESEQFLEVSTIDSTSTDMYRSLKELQKSARKN